MIVFDKRNSRRKRKRWWSEEQIEEQTIFKYLEDTFEKNEKHKSHVKNVVKKAMAVL